MSIPVKKLREMVLQLLFSLDMGSEEKDALFALMMEELKVTRKRVGEALETAKNVYMQKELLDKEITKVSQEYALERIGKVERNILRLAIFELFQKTLPKEVIISEAIRLSIKFSTPESANFVNAILDATLKQVHDPLSL